MKIKGLLIITLLGTVLMGASCEKKATTEEVEIPSAPAQEVVPEVVSEVPKEEPTALPVLTTEPEAQAAKKVFDLVLNEFKFEPSVITVKKGDEVTINAKAIDTAHGLSIPEFKVNLTVPAGQTVTTTFVADKVGTYTFRCSVFCGSGHRDMTGTFIVTE